jgi:hypothetical protein
MLLPDIATRTLQGVDKARPRDLPAERTLVLLPFQQWQQREVDAWIGRADDAGWATDLSGSKPGGLPEFAVIEVPCISRRWGPVRRFIDGGMASGIGVPVVLARTWTSYTDVGRVQRALDIPDSSHTWVGVVERGGEVLQTAFGEPDEHSWREIAEAMGRSRE